MSAWLHLPSSSLLTRRRSSLVITGTLVVIALLVFFSSHSSYRDLQNHLYDYLPGSTDKQDSPEEPPASPPQSLSKSDFETPDADYHAPADHNRFVSGEAWRPASVYDAGLVPPNRPLAPPLDTYNSKAQYHRQALVADYPEHAEKVFVMLKEGATVLWQRVPTHLLTTFTKVPHFGLYADMPASIGGHEVHDVLANVSDRTMRSGQFDLYRKLRDLRRAHAVVDPAAAELSGGWDLDKYKNVPMLAHALKTAPPSVDWFVFMDGDTYFFMDSLVAYLNELDATQPLYLGAAAAYKGVTFAHGGSGVVLSRRALEVSLGDHPEWEHTLEDETRDSCCGDYVVAYMMERANVTISRGEKYPYVSHKFQGQPHWNLDANDKAWCSPIISFHHLSPLEIELLWEYERMIGPERRKFITYSDIYRDFVAPHIKEKMHNWNSMAGDLAFSRKEDDEVREKNREGKNAEQRKKTLQVGFPVLSTRDDENLPVVSQETPKSDDDQRKAKDALARPWHSEALCEKACDNWRVCLSWRYLPGDDYCGLGKAPKLGRPVLEDISLSYVEGEKQRNLAGAVSGYRVDRIRAMRKTRPCDVLYRNAEQKDDAAYLQRIADGAVQDRYEGWYARALTTDLAADEARRRERQEQEERQDREREEREKKGKEERERKEKEKKKDN